MSTPEETTMDVEELKRLHDLAERPTVKEILKSKIEKLKSRETVTAAKSNIVVESEPKSDISKDPDQPSLAATMSRRTVAAPKYYKDITTYAWDQSDKFMKLYVTVKGVQKLAKENVTVEFKNKSFRLRIENLDGSNYQCHVAFLWDDIVPADSYHKVKTDSVLVMLKKAVEKKTWAYVTERDDKKKKDTPKPDEKKDPNETLMDLLKQMYVEGDDEMKRTIAKSFSQSRNKTPADNMDS